MKPIVRRENNGDGHWPADRVMLAAFVVATSVVVVAAGPAETPRLETNQAYVDEATHTSALAIDDPMAVLTFVLASLPDRVRVYPTENYYYFGFVHAGTRYAGNIRLAAADRDQGKVHFEYYQERSQWSATGAEHTTVLDASRGVSVERLERLLYRVSYGNRSVVFALNDLAEHKPPSAILATDEKFLGPIFDESGIRFFLVYNAKLKIFHYILDETVPVADAFLSARRTDRIVIGKRTAFAFYRDHRLTRKILIGVFEANSQLNTPFDGPFDQLPENFIPGDELRDAIVDADPVVKGQIDRLGNFVDGSGRYLIHPYRLYRHEDDLYAAHRCAERSRTASYYRCFILDSAGQGGLLGRELPARGRRGAR